jgi:hypothetical protein
VAAIGAWIQYLVAQQNNTAQQNLTNTTLKSQELLAEVARQKDFIQLASNILSQPIDKNKREQRAMRFWAAEVVLKNSPVTVPDIIIRRMADPEYDPDDEYHVGRNVYKNELDAYRGLPAIRVVQ